MNDTGVIVNFYKQLNSGEEDRTKVMRSFLLYILERKPEQKDYAMLFKLIKDFDYDIAFDALVSAHYSTVDFSGNFWGYIITICKNLMKETITENTDDVLAKRTKDLITDLRSKLEGVTYAQ